MAQVDIAGLLTGIPSLQDPMTQGRINAANLPANSSAISRTLARYQPENEARMRQAVGGLMSTLTGQDFDLRTQGAKSREAIGQLDPNSPKYQAQLLTQLSKVDPMRAAALKSVFDQQAIENRTKLADAGIGQVNMQFYTAESVEAYRQNFKLTGEKNYSLLKEIDSTAALFRDETMRQVVKSNNDRSKAANNANDQDFQYNKLLELMKDGTLNTGAFAKFSLEAKKALSAVTGVDIESLDKAEAFTAITNQLALRIRNPDSGLGLTGNTSNADLQFLRESIPSLERTIGGNRLIIQIAMEQNAWKRRIFKKQQQIIADNGGVPPLDLNEQVSEYAGSPESGMLSEETKNKIKTIETEVADGDADYVDGVTSASVNSRSTADVLTNAKRNSNQTQPSLPAANSLPPDSLQYLKEQGIAVQPIQPTQPNKSSTNRG